MLVLAAVPTLVFHKISLTQVVEKYFMLLASSIILSFVSSLFCYLLAKVRNTKDPNQICSKGNTGNIITDFFHGPNVNPTFMGCNLKLQTFRFSMIGVALLNVLILTESSLTATSSPAVLVAASLQVLYAMDAMWFEEYYFCSHDYLHSGYGWALISSYLTFPFIPTLITRYMLARQPQVNPLNLTAICVLNIIGYIIYRSSESRRAQLSASGVGVAPLQTSGWWGLVRHPAFLGEIIIQWTWVLPLVGSLELAEVAAYYLPVVTTLMLMVRSRQINSRNHRKYGKDWLDYSKKVRSNIFPLAF